MWVPCQVRPSRLGRLWHIMYPCSSRAWSALPSLQRFFTRSMVGRAEAGNRQQAFIRIVARCTLAASQRHKPDCSAAEVRVAAQVTGNQGQATVSGVPSQTVQSRP
jgi:hypothetical protein